LDAIDAQFEKAAGSDEQVIFSTEFFTAIGGAFAIIGVPTLARATLKADNKT
jgi:hypothetical protein